MKIYFSLVNKIAYDEFIKEFDGVSNVYFDQTPLIQLIERNEIDCCNTTANSYGRMDGGIDGFINMFMTPFEPNVSYFHERVQRIISDRYMSEQPVGTCLLVPTYHPKIKFVAHTPTMKVPEDVSETINAYLAFRALLVEVLWHNKNNKKEEIKSVACTPFCTSSGSMSYKKCAKQMKAAYDSVFVKLPQVTDWKLLHEAHRKLVALN
jgi:O-acetyl-ADP-ribose deacetylase (regulator of RNase III)